MPEPLSIVFCGTSTFALPSLAELAEDGRFRIAGVITQPDKPVGRKRVPAASPVKIVANKLGVTVLQPKNFNDELASMKLLRPDFLVVVSYGQILAQHVLDFPRVAPVNLHGSLLPKLRGASPIHNTLLEGLSETGVTVQRMTSALDAGPILAQATVAIDPRETFTTLHEKLAILGSELLRDTLLKPLEPIEQDHTQATVCRKLTRADGIVDPKTMTAEEIDRKVRALNPWPGVTLKNVKLLATELEPAPDALPLPCKGNSVLYVTRLQPSGKKPMTGAEFARGHTL